jgi:N-acetylmuramoyl-L-alanine amidase
MKILISSGHSTKCQGASGHLNEVEEATRTVNRVFDIWKAAGIPCNKFHDTISNDSSENLNRIVDWHNSQTRDLDVSVHFNAGGGTGTEVLYVTQQSLSDRVSAAIADAADWTDRGPKYRSDLFFLNNTEEPAILVEVCFVDSSSDAQRYNQRFEAICQAVAESISGQDLDAPIDPPEQPPAEVTGDNRVDITAATDGHVSVICNGTLMHGHEDCEHTVRFTLATQGDAVVVINGEEFHNYPSR